MRCHLKADMCAASLPVLPLALSPFSSPFLDKEADVEDEFRRVAKQDHKTFKVKFHTPQKQIVIRGGGLKGSSRLAASGTTDLDTSSPVELQLTDAGDEPVDVAGEEEDVAANDAEQHD